MRCPHCGSDDVVRCNTDWDSTHSKNECRRNGYKCYRETWKCFPKQHTWTLWGYEDNEY